MCCVLHTPIWLFLLSPKRIYKFYTTIAIFFLADCMPACLFETMHFLHYSVSSSSKLSNNKRERTRWRLIVCLTLIANQMCLRICVSSSRLHVYSLNSTQFILLSLNCLLCVFFFLLFFFA
jgi:hypothetical protein